MQAFAQQKGCFACHDINTIKVGPAFKDVAKKFAGQPGAEEEISKRIKNGGVGTWGNVPMPPQNVTVQEAWDLAGLAVLPAFAGRKRQKGLPLPLLKIDTSSCYTSLGEIIRCIA